MGPITKLTRKTKTFLWIKECYKAWELNKQKYIEALILISPNQQVEFHVHTIASLLAMGVMLFHNVARKSDQPIVYAFKLLNKTKKIYSTIERKKNQQWFLFCTSSNITCQAISLFFMWILWHQSIWSTNHKFQGEQLNGCYYSQNMIS